MSWGFDKCRAIWEQWRRRHISKKGNIGNFGKHYIAEEILKTALKKHSDNDQFFCSLDDYDLCYPDQKTVEFIPGTTESFTVEKYKEEFLSKPYSKMDLFSCNISVYGNCSNMKNSKSNASSNQSEKKVENDYTGK